MTHGHNPLINPSAVMDLFYDRHRIRLLVGKLHKAALSIFNEMIHQ